MSAALRAPRQRELSIGARDRQITGQGYTPVGFGFNGDDHYFAWLQNGTTYELVHQAFSSSAETTVNTRVQAGFTPIAYGFNPDQHYFAWMHRPCP